MRKDSIPYRPHAGEETEVAGRRAEVSMDTPEPPPIDDLVRELARELFAAFPPRS
jgi:hypothetical protein